MRICGDVSSLAFSAARRLRGRSALARRSSRKVHHPSAARRLRRAAPYGNFFGAPSRSISRKGAIITGRYWLVCCPESSSDRGLVDRTSWLGHRGKSWATPEGTGSRPARAGKDQIITHPIGHETGWTAARSLGELGNFGTLEASMLLPIKIAVLPIDGKKETVERLRAQGHPILTNPLKESPGRHAVMRRPTPTRA